jgi:hypothetical protein
MNDAKALIAEARKWTYRKVTNQPVAANDIIRRLADALEAMEVELATTRFDDLDW